MYENILLDILPKEYEGYLINYSFRTGILISQALSDIETFKDDDDGRMERLFTGFNLLFGKGLPPFKIALNGLKWFMSCGASENKEINSKNSNEYFSFDADKDRLFSSFMVKYGINLNRDDLHFFEFIALFNDLSKTSFRNVVDLRQMNNKELKKFSKEDRIEILKQKKYFAIKKTLNNKFTEEQTKSIDKFDKLVGIYWFIINIENSKS